MTPQKLTGFHKIVSFILVAIILILVIGFVANAWIANENIPDSGDVGNSTNDTDGNDDNNGTNNKNDTLNNEYSDDNTNSEDSNQDASEEKPTVYTNPITGLVVSETQYSSIPLATVVNPVSPLYGVSNADIAIEFPLEDGSSRMLVYNTSEAPLWKIGALVPTRSFISSMSAFFGGMVVSYGDDGKFISSVQESSYLIDISKYSDCYYIENGKYVYTAENMIELAHSKSENYQPVYQYKTAPYIFYETQSFVGTGNASTIIIPYSEKNETELYYHEKSGEYLYYKSANKKVDMLTGENIAFTNVFILFADATTYEKSDGCELIFDVLSSGKGYYASGGTYTEFIWKTDVSGELSFYTLSGDKLQVNAGNSYFSYYKSSSVSNVTIN